MYAPGVLWCPNYFVPSSPNDQASDLEFRGFKFVLSKEKDNASLPKISQKILTHTLSLTALLLFKYKIFSNFLL